VLMISSVGESSHSRHTRVKCVKMGSPKLTTSLQTPTTLRTTHYTTPRSDYTLQWVQQSLSSACGSSARGPPPSFQFEDRGMHHSGATKKTRCILYFASKEFGTTTATRWHSSYVNSGSNYKNHNKSNKQSLFEIVLDLATTVLSSRTLSYV